jgi:hypothetical protein
LTTKMLGAGRPVELSHIAAFGKLALDPLNALTLLDAVISDMSSETVRRVVPRNLQGFLGYLSARKDIGDVELAQRELRVLPALGYHHGLDLRLYKVLAEDPSLFIEFVCQVYRPEKDQGPPHDVNDESRALATRAFQILASWHHRLNPSERRANTDASAGRPFPGEDAGGSIDSGKLMAWVSTARTKAKEADRLNTADFEIGQLLAYSLSDPDQDVWPVKAVRAVIETHYSKDLERGLLNELFNKRGVHGVVEGGKEEQGFVDEATRWAKAVKKQSRHTHAVLTALAKMWGKERERAVEWERQRKLAQRQ